MTDPETKETGPMLQKLRLAIKEYAKEQNAPVRDSTMIIVRRRQVFEAAELFFAALDAHDGKEKSK